MKRLLTTLVVLTGLFAPSLAVAGEGVNYYDLVTRDGLSYEKFTEEPFTGKTEGLKQYTFRRGKGTRPVCPPLPFECYYAKNFNGLLS